MVEEDFDRSGVTMDLKNLEDYLNEIDLEMIENQVEVRITDKDFEKSSIKVINNIENSNSKKDNERVIV